MFSEPKVISSPKTIFFLMLACIVLGCIIFTSKIVHANSVYTVAQDEVIIDSQIVCAPGTSNTCFPGPYTEIYTSTQEGDLAIDVFLIHTGGYEPNEQSTFSSPYGNLDCGPIPPGVDELFCGSVFGQVSSGQEVPLTIEHSGGGESTGSHQQRYHLTVQDVSPTETPTPTDTPVPPTDTPTPTATFTPTPTSTLPPPEVWQLFLPIISRTGSECATPACIPFHWNE